MTRPRTYPEYRASDVPWVDQVPAGWLTLPLYSVLRETKTPNLGMVESNLLSLSYGRIIRKDIKGSEGLLPESFETYQVVEPGDLVFRFTDLQNDKRSLRSALVVERGIITSAYVAVTPRGITPEFAAYLMRSYDTTKVFYGLGGGVRQSLKFDDVRRLPVLVPPPAEQRAIADYLDRETAQIDALIGKQERLIETLQERRAAMVERAFMDVDPAWPVDKLGRGTRIGNGSTPKREQAEFWLDGDFPWLNSAVVNQPAVEESDQFVTSTALTTCHLPVVSPGSILVGLTGQGRTRGMATILQIPATVSQHVAFVTPAASWHRRYLLWTIRANYTHLRNLSDENGSTKGGLTCEDLKRIRVVRPPLDEQRRIAAYLDEQTIKIDVLIARVGRFIEVSKERRSALITAAVTGQIDVRGLMDRGVEVARAQSGANQPQQEVQPA